MTSAVATRGIGRDMSIDSPWPTVLGVILLLVLVRAPIFGPADEAATRHGGRVATLDGLRGFLALAVFSHHAAIYHVYVADGRWLPPSSRFHAMLGQVGVALFFMITGFLFWGKLLAERGRPDWRRLYIGRVFRIGPLYVVAIAMLIVIVFARSGWQLHGTLFGLVKGCAWWLALGALGPGPDLDRLADTWIILAGVTWTLRYEWWFYAALPPMALVVRAGGRWPALSCLGGFVAGCVATALTATDAVVALPVVSATLFGAGALAASVPGGAIVRATPPVLTSTLVVALVAATFASPSMNRVGAILPLTGAFALIAWGCDLFGLLATRGARRLGDISYGLYLLQGLVLATVFASPPVRAFALGSGARYWGVILGCAVILMVIATLAFVAIERPGIAWGRRVGRLPVRDAVSRARPVPSASRDVPDADAMRYGAGMQGAWIVDDE